MNVKVGEFLWEDPPKPPVGMPHEAHAFQAEAQAMRENPGQWMRVTEYPKTRHETARMMATRISHAKLVAFRPRGSFQAVSRTVTTWNVTAHGEVATAVVRVYARYTGNTDSA